VGTLLALFSIVLAVVLLWAGIKHLEIGTYWKATITILDLLVLGASVVLLGWLGLILFAAANVLAVLVTSVRMAMQKEEKLVYASTQCGASKEDLEALYEDLGREGGPFAVMGPLQRADLISRLAQRARSVEEMRQMAPPIAMLWGVHKPDLDWLVDRFDQLLRLYNMDASRSMEAADVIAAATQTAAGTFEEMVEAMVVVATP